MDGDGALGLAGPVSDGGKFPTSRRLQPSSAPDSKILLKDGYNDSSSNDDTHSTPRIFTPCRWAAFIHPGGGTVTR